MGPLTMPHLGGWWRLWIAVSALFAILLVGEAHDAWPDREDVLATQDVFNSRQADWVLSKRYPEQIGTDQYGRRAFAGDAEVLRQVLDSLADHALGGGRDPVGRELARQRWVIVRQMATVWSVIAGGLLAVGLTLRWIWRGFVKGGT